MQLVADAPVLALRLDDHGLTTLESGIPGPVVRREGLPDVQLPRFAADEASDVSDYVVSYAFAQLATSLVVVVSSAAPTSRHTTP